MDEREVLERNAWFRRRAMSMPVMPIGTAQLDITVTVKDGKVEVERSYVPIQQNHNEAPRFFGVSPNNGGLPLSQLLDLFDNIGHERLTACERCCGSGENQKWDPDKRMMVTVPRGCEACAGAGKVAVP